MNKSIDKLVSIHGDKKLELKNLGKQIAESETFTVVAFVDLSDSTQLKQQKESHTWLGHIHGFIKFIDTKCQSVGGVTVKRIGDELMLTFASTKDSESFVESIISDNDSSLYTFEIALDAGKAFHFKFDNLIDDPYGSVIDRCARIAKLAGSGTVLCSSNYLASITEQDKYISIGSFSLRCFYEPENLFIRSLVITNSEIYLEPLLSSVRSCLAKH